VFVNKQLRMRNRLKRTIQVQLIGNTNRRRGSITLLRWRSAILAWQRSAIGLLWGITLWGRLLAIWGLTVALLRRWSTITARRRSSVATLLRRVASWRRVSLALHWWGLAV
jgi:hypothetical protein